MAQAYTSKKKEKQVLTDKFGRLACSFQIEVEDVRLLDSICEDLGITRSRFFQIVTNYAVHKKNRKGNTILRDMNKFYLESILNGNDKDETEDQGE